MIGRTNIILNDRKSNDGKRGVMGCTGVQARELLPLLCTAIEKHVCP